MANQFASHAPMLCQALKNRDRDVCRWREIRVGQCSVEPQILHADFDCDRFAFGKRQPDCLCGKQINWIAKTLMQDNHPENHDASLDNRGFGPADHSGSTGTAALTKDGSNF
ncbi:hypothetical protein [uncultured Agrobacterium sp.]|uniref:hypothetical protein n=1 Tax=uncultured Agrobacterium sp. TaxID=157277 RepID=UPI0034205278